MKESEDEDVEIIDLNVPEMDCDSCAGKVRNNLDQPYISDCSTNTATGTVTVSYDSEKVTDNEIIDLVEKSGYEVIEGDITKNVLKDSRAVKTGLSGVFVLLGLIFEFILPDFNYIVLDSLLQPVTISTMLYLVAILFGGAVIFRSGYKSVQSRSLDIDMLVSVAIIGSVTAGIVFGESLYFEAGMLAFLFNIAELLESYSINKARSSLEDLMDISPDKAVVKREGEEVEVSIDKVGIGETVIVRPGSRIPLDGEVVDGESAVNQSPITGESIPVDKTEGDEVFAGTINEEGYLEIETTKKANENTISRIIQTVEEAQKSKTDKEKFVDRFASYYTPSVVLMGIILAVFPPLLLNMSWVTYILYGLTLFVLACPCALVISTPVSVVSGVTSAANNGILVKSGENLEFMNDVDTIAMDKTGTITKGELKVTDIIPLNGHETRDVLECAYGIESKSEHPISNAIEEEAYERDVHPEEAKEFKNMAGKGIKGELHGENHYAGKPSLFKDEGFDLSHVHSTTDRGLTTDKTREICEKNNCLNLLEDVVPELQSEGKTVIIVGTSQEIEGLIAIEDEIRPSAQQAIEELRNCGVDNIVMLTGDNDRVANSVAEKVNVDEYYSELLPDDKVQKIEDLKEDGDTVAMIGDGVNDAPSLAVSDVSVAMGVAGTDMALETADIALMKDDLLKLPYLYKLSSKTSNVIKQNIISSILVKALLVIAVPFGLVPVWVAVLIGDAGMTVGVTGNAMRISNYED